MKEQAISACKQALCQLTLCLSTKGHKSCVLQMVLRSINLTVKVLPKELLRTWFITKVESSKSRCIVTCHTLIMIYGFCKL